MFANCNKRTFVQNTILACLSLPDLRAISPFLEPVLLKERTILHEPKRSIEHVYFVESGIVSLRIVAGESALETAIVGSRGAVGVSFLLGEHTSIHQSLVLFPGSALRIRVDDLRRVIGEHPQILGHLLRYVQALITHGAQAALCGVRHELEQRLACWLCLANDAFASQVLPVTHDYLSAALGLRRAGITETLIRFEEQGLIRKMRGTLQVDDRKRLEQRACRCYDVIAGGYAIV